MGHHQLKIGYIPLLVKKAQFIKFLYMGKKMLCHQSNVYGCLVLIMLPEQIVYAKHQVCFDKHDSILDSIITSTRIIKD